MKLTRADLDRLNRPGLAETIDRLVNLILPWLLPFAVAWITIDTIIRRAPR